VSDWYVVGDYGGFGRYPTYLSPLTLAEGGKRSTGT